MSDAAAAKRQAMQQYRWYHTIDLGDGVTTPGKYDHQPLLQHYGLPETLEGKTVLDIGPAHGFFAFEFERRGAARVVTCELPKWSMHDGDPDTSMKFRADDDHPDTKATLHGALDFAIAQRNSKVERLYQTIYDISPSTTGTFDIVFCGSVLLHLTDPLRALYAIRTVTREVAIIATGIDPSRISRGPVARFVGKPGDHTFWLPTLECLVSWAKAASFGRVEKISRFQVSSRDCEFQTLHGCIKAYPD